MSSLLQAVRCFFTGDCLERGPSVVNRTRELMRQNERDWAPVRERIEEEQRNNSELRTAMEDAVSPDLMGALRRAREAAGQSRSRSEAGQ